MIKKALLFLLLSGITLHTGIAQDSKKEAKETQKESKAEKKERHKQFWKKVGNDQRDFWKGEHERHVAKQEGRKARKAKEKEKADDQPASDAAAKKTGNKNKSATK